MHKQLLAKEGTEPQTHWQLERSKTSLCLWAYDNATSDVKVFGIEGFWGNVWEGMAGLIFNTKIKVKMTPPYNFDGAGYIDTGIIPSGTSGGYVSSASVTR